MAGIDGASVRRRQSDNHQRGYPSTRVCSRLLRDARNRDSRRADSSIAPVPRYEDWTVQGLLHLLLYNPCIHAERITKRQLEGKRNEPRQQHSDLDHSLGSLLPAHRDIRYKTKHYDGFDVHSFFLINRPLRDDISYLAEFD